MKRITSVALLMISLLSARITARSQETGKANQTTFTEIHDINGKGVTIKTAQLEKTSFPFSNEWNDADIVFENNRIAKNIPVLYNLYDHQLYFRKDTAIFLFADKVASFRIVYNNGEGKRFAWFRNGYPSSQKLNGNTYYQVLAEGPAQLLKYSSKFPSDNKSSGEAMIYRLTEEYYAYNTSTKTIVRIKDKSSLINAFPHYANVINDFAAQKNSRLQSETELTQLFNALNQ